MKFLRYGFACFRLLHNLFFLIRSQSRSGWTTVCASLLIVSILMPKTSKVIAQQTRQAATIYCDQLVEPSGGLTGNFSSPRTPDGVYPPNTRCRYKFRAGSAHVVRITWYTFRLEEPFIKTNNFSSSMQCLRDYVEVIIMDYQDVQHVHGRYCGSKLPPNFSTMQQSVDVVFQTSYTKHYAGFTGHYEFVPEENIGAPRSMFNASLEPAVKSACGGIASRAGLHGGVITSPGYPETFPALVDCFWLIRVRPDHKIFIKLTELQLSTGLADCNNAYLNVIDGYAHYTTEEPDNLPSTQQVRFCGEKHYLKEEGQKTFNSERNRLLIRFKTTKKPVQELIDKRAAEKLPVGFHLVWTEVPDPKETISKKCEQFLCKGGEYCLDAGRAICIEKTQYCIDTSLVCDGIPNCAEDDNSDEEHCYSWEIILVGGAIFGALVLVILLVICCQRRGPTRSRATDEGDVQIRKIPRKQWKRNSHSAQNNTEYRPASSTATLTATANSIQLDAGPARTKRRPTLESHSISTEPLVQQEDSSQRQANLRPSRSIPASVSDHAPAPRASAKSKTPPPYQSLLATSSKRPSVSETAPATSAPSAPQATHAKAADRTSMASLRQLDESPSARYKELRSMKATMASQESYHRAQFYRAASGSESDDQLLVVEPPLSTSPNHVPKLPPKVAPKPQRTPPPYHEAMARTHLSQTTRPALGGVYVPDAMVRQSPELKHRTDLRGGVEISHVTTGLPYSRQGPSPLDSRMNISERMTPQPQPQRSADLSTSESSEGMPIWATEAESAINAAIRRRTPPAGVGIQQHVFQRQASTTSSESPKPYHGGPLKHYAFTVHQPSIDDLRPGPSSGQRSATPQTLLQVARLSDRQKGRSPPPIELHELKPMSSPLAFTAPGGGPFPPPPPEFLAFPSPSPQIYRAPSPQQQQTERQPREVVRKPRQGQQQQPVPILKCAHMAHSSFPPPVQQAGTKQQQQQQQQQQAASSRSVDVPGYMPPQGRLPPIWRVPQGSVDSAPFAEAIKQIVAVRDVPTPPPKPPLVAAKGHSVESGAPATSKPAIPRSALKSASTASSATGRTKSVEFRDPPASPNISLEPSPAATPSKAPTNDGGNAEITSGLHLSGCSKMPRGPVPSPLTLTPAPGAPEGTDDDESPGPWHLNEKPTSV